MPVQYRSVLRDIQPYSITPYSGDGLGRGERTVHHVGDSLRWLRLGWLNQAGLPSGRVSQNGERHF